MRSVKLYYIFLFSFAYHLVYSQDYFSFGQSNYGGVLQVISNPASAADSKLKVDVIPFGFDFSFNNSWVAVKKESLSFPNLPNSWKNFTPNVDENIYKNFDWQNVKNKREVIYEQRLMLPSALVRIDSENSISFFSSFRQIGNLGGVSKPLANLFENEFDLSVLQNNPVQNTNLSAVRMSWMEYGLSYSRSFNNKGTHRFKAGITPKLLKGIEASYFILKNLNFLFSNKDTLSYLNADFSVAHSTRKGSALDFGSNISEKIQRPGEMSAGIDLGFIYEWHPLSFGKDTKSEKHRSAIAQYKIKAGISIVDLGKIRFKKEKNYYEMQLAIKQTDILKYVTATNLKVVDSLLNADFPANKGDSQFSLLMPTAINTQVDYSINKYFFVNMSAHITGFYQTNFFKVKNYSAICFSPRFETYWVDASLLLTWNALSNKRSQTLTPGLNMRFGPLSIGSNDFSFLFKRSGFSSLNFYAMLHVSIPYKNHIKKPIAEDKKK